ncbi:MAG TPA: tetratricopeptide repeat protein [Spirochaetia bacterium]|nr:tetratricopeptide repeat protein [Spirochaetia bacterium]
MDGESAETIPDRGELRASYSRKRPEFAFILGDMERRIRACLEAANLRPILKGRIKSFDSWYAKRIRLLRQAKAAGKAPIPITDVIALRAVCPFLGDLGRAEAAIGAAFSVLEVERKGSERSFREFGYESIHILVKLPDELLSSAAGLDAPVVELQLRTILQEAWAEVEHELVYKAEFTPFDEPMKRKLAALNANLSLSDIIFQEILDYQRRLNSELERRRSSFHGKIEDAMDRPLAADGASAGLPAETAGPEPASGRAEAPAPAEALPQPLLEPGQAASMDDLLLAALTAHNREDFPSAIGLYSEILARGPAKDVATMVYKHRGMALFSQSRYREAIEDFGKSLELDPQCYKAAYYRGVVRSVLQDFPGAIEDFDLALGIHPYHFYSRYRRGMAYWHLEDYAQALADSESALKLEPDNAPAQRLKALAMAKLAM